MSASMLSVASPACSSAGSYVRAPGKAVLMGEYGVLFGGPAVVATVGCYAEAKRSSVPTRSPYIRAAQSFTARWLRMHGHTVPQGIPCVNSQDFYKEGRKLGLGSSAAVTVSSVGLWFVHAGLPIEKHLDTIHKIAKQAHNHAQDSQGSGVDIFSIVYGGIRVFQGTFSPSSPLPGVPLLISTPTALSTKRAVYAFRQLGVVAEMLADRMAQTTQRFIKAWHIGDYSSAHSAMEETVVLYRFIGRSIGLSLMTPLFERILQAARMVGGTAKPSGAGGGDIAIAFFPSTECIRQFQRFLPKDVQILSYPLGVPGLQEGYTTEPL